MAGPGGREVGRVSIRVLPDTSKFGTSLKAYLERIERRLELEIPVSLDARTVAQTEAELELLTRDREIDIELNTQALASGVSSVTRGLARWAPLIVGAGFAIGALVGALPALVANIGTPIGAIALGFDGVKEAASGLTDEVDRLKKSLSDTFERLLTPGFKRLGELFSTLKKGLEQVAGGVASVFDSFSRTITDPESLKTIADIFANIGQALEDFAAGGGVDALTNSLLLLTDAGTVATKTLTPELVAQIHAFNEELERMKKNGDLQKAMEGIGHAFLFISLVIGAFVLAGLEFFAMLERLGEAIVTFATKTVPEGWAALKVQTARDWHSLVSTIDGAWESIKTSTVDAVESVVSTVLTLPARLTEVGADAVQGLWDGFSGKIAEFKTWLEGQATDILGIISGIWSVDSPSKEFRKIGQFAGEGLQLGFEDSMKDVQATAALLATGTLRAASAASFLPSDLQPQADRPIRMSDGTLFGWVRTIANGEAELVLNTQAFAAGVA